MTTTPPPDTQVMTVEEALADDCACHIRGDMQIIYCPLHGAAPYLLAALRESAEFGHRRGAYHHGSFDYCTKRQCIAARQAIRKAEGVRESQQP